MATQSSILAWEILWTAACWTTDHVVATTYHAHVLYIFSNVL